MSVNPVSGGQHGLSHGQAHVLSVRLSSDNRRRIENAAAKSYPKEACGLLIGRTAGKRTMVEQVIVAHNLRVQRAHERYLLDPDDFLKAERWARGLDLDVVGIWHSHPDHPPLPSSTDLAAAWADYSYLIVSVAQGRVEALRSWRLHKGIFIEERLE